MSKFFPPVVNGKPSYALSGTNQSRVYCALHLGETINNLIVNGRVSKSMAYAMTHQMNRDTGRTNYPQHLRLYWAFQKHTARFGELHDANLPRQAILDELAPARKRASRRVVFRKAA